MAVALKEAYENRQRITDHLNKLNEYTINKLSRIDGCHINGKNAKTVPNIISASFYGIDGEALVRVLSKSGIMVATGSACSSTDYLLPNHVLSSIGIEKELINGTIRISYSKNTSEDEVKYLIEQITTSVAYVRKLSPSWNAKHIFS